LSKYAEEYSKRELLAAFISRDINDGEVILIGANLPACRAGILLAHLTHAPNMQWLQFYRANYSDVKEIESVEFVTDYSGFKYCEEVPEYEHLWDTIRKYDVSFFGGIQIDKYGNINLLGIGGEYPKLMFRGPGAIGQSTITTYVGRYYIYTERHLPLIFVDKCEYITAVGWGDGGDSREKLGLPGGGPKYVLTPLCIMDFEEKTKRMRLKSIHPGVSIEDVKANTGFELIIPDDVPETEPPTKKELEIIRTRIDLTGILKEL
jgi:glutaconate CoA-transferase subunit B